MKRFLSLFAVALVACVLTATAPRAGFAQQTTKTSSTTPASSSSSSAPVDVPRIISAFSAKETEFRQALSNYAFTRDVTIQSIGLGGEAKGEYRRVSSFVFDDKGARYEKITFFPMPTLTDLLITQDDLEDLGGIQPYALEASKIDQYKFTYIGKERIDELDLYVFDVQPKVMPDPKKTKERFFQGRIWVDDKDLQIVKVRGKAIPETKNARFPTFETYREQVDGRYWFPTYTYADEDLVFKEGTIHMRMSVRYKDYKKFGSTVIIKDVDPDEKDPN
ncbi:MAG: hypothetical protein ICV60_02745 [Pyrinomonadaceae bacterium]|nr:hypothetical protein [Pyrinomonadaceae bacterium]